MAPNYCSLAAIVRKELLNNDGVHKFLPNRRFAPIFEDGGTADSMFYLEAGIVKLSKRGEESKEVIVDIVAPGELFGEQALDESGIHNVSAEVLQEGSIYVIPREIFTSFCEEHPELWRLLTEFLTYQKKRLEKKIELLSLHDVEYRVVYYLSELCGTIGVRVSQQEYSIPLSQGELANLVGATRETTSTTLNGLARRGLIKLGRRQVGVLCLEDMRAPFNTTKQ